MQVHILKRSSFQAVRVGESPSRVGALGSAVIVVLASVWLAVPWLVVVVVLRLDNAGRHQLDDVHNFFAWLALHVRGKSWPGWAL